MRRTLDSAAHAQFGVDVTLGFLSYNHREHGAASWPLGTCLREPPTAQHHYPSHLGVFHHCCRFRCGEDATRPANTGPHTRFLY